jgi:hypothetical protein
LYSSRVIEEMTAPVAAREASEGAGGQTEPAGPEQERTPVHLASGKILVEIVQPNDRIVN